MASITHTTDATAATAQFLDILHDAREICDDAISKKNRNIMAKLRRERRRVISEFHQKLNDLAPDIRATVSATLLSNQDFNFEMDFSESISNNQTSVLAWSCVDNSLSSDLWKTAFKACIVEEPTLPQSPSSTLSTMFTTTAHSSIDIARTPITMPPLREKHSRKSSSRKEEYGTLTKSPPGRPRKRSSATRGGFHKKSPWSQQEINTLTEYCTGKGSISIEGQEKKGSTFWRFIASLLPGRTADACILKWKRLRISKGNSGY